MIRIVLILLAFVGGVLFLRWFVRTPAEVIGRGMRRILALAVIGLVLFLTVTGRLSPVWAALGTLAAYLVKMFPHLLRYVPLLHRIWVTSGAARGAQGRHYGRDGRGGGAPMTAEEAYQVLGLRPGATRNEIVDAHRRLMQKVHPDRGGSEYFAAKLNQARDLLLRH